MDRTIEQQMEQLIRKEMEKIFSRKKLVIANWKMNMTVKKAIPLLTHMSDVTNQNVEVVICPAFPMLYPIKDLLQKLNSSHKVGAQNVHFEDEGAHTGEVSGSMLAEIGCHYAIIGHSERRIAGETDEIIEKKVRQSLSHHMKPVICVGETKNDREQGRANQIIKQQLKDALQNVFTMTSIVIAYEPIWAIGTGQSAEPEQIREMHETIRSTLVELDKEAGFAVPILYGGSVKAENAKQLSEIEDVDGVLVGGASLDAEAFNMIIQAFE